MAGYRGLLTDRERKILAGEAAVSANYTYQVRSRVRQKIKRLTTDVELLETHQPDLAAQLRAALAGAMDAAADDRAATNGADTPEAVADTDEPDDGEDDEPAPPTD